MAKGDLARNLAHLCAPQKSISHVCRELGINRQQFGRYLTGANRPSMHNLSRICRYFSVSIDDVVLPHDAFRRLDTVRPLAGFDALGLPSEIAAELLDLSTRPNESLDDHVGWYHRYHYAFGFRGYVFRTLFVVRRVGRHVYTKHVERIPRNNAPTNATLTFKYRGLMLSQADRLFVIERDSSSRGLLHHTVYAPLLRPGKRLLSGVGCSLASTTGNDPSASRSVLEYLGREVDMRAALRPCGLFHPDDGAIDPYVLSMIDNRNRRKEYVFRAHRG